MTTDLIEGGESEGRKDSPRHGREVRTVYQPYYLGSSYQR